MISIDWQALSPIGSAVGWTILHSLWQLTLLAFSLAFALRFVSRKRAALRYGILLAGLALAPAISGITFAWLWPGAAPGAPHFPVESAAAETVLLPVPAPAESDALTGDGWQALAASIDTHTPHIAIAWLIGMCGFLIYLISGLFYLRFLQQHQVQAPDPAWKNRFVRLCRQIGVSGKVQLLLSGKVSEPVTFRLFRPVILIPFSLFTGLTTAQIEVLLLHELSHIRRYDFVINLLQTLTEMLFFYHPALWWISGKIREEREHCCDDLVMAVQRNPVLYAEALTQLQAHQLFTKKRLAMSATGKKSLLRKRVFRLFGQYEEQPSIFKSLIMALLLSGICFSAQGFFDHEKPKAVRDWPLEASTGSPEEPVALAREAEAPSSAERRASPGNPDSVPSLPEVPAVASPEEVLEIAPPPGEHRPLPHMAPLPALSPLAPAPRAIQSIQPGGASLRPARDSLPLFVIDGKVMGAYRDRPILESIDPNDIESISVLKGEAAMDKYGDSGAFGVIEIRTKGKAGENKQIRVRGPVKVRAAPAEKANSRSGVVSGKVTGENQGPLIGATVLIQGTNIGTVTDLEGNYRLELPDECATLIVSYVGRKTAVVQNACRDQQIGVVLEEEGPATGATPGATPSELAQINLQAYPNPSGGQVNIEFHLEKAARVQLGVYGLDGKLLQQLVDGELAAGTQKSIWQGSDHTNGVYLIQLQIEGAAFETISRKVVVE